jgi:acyl transferase domain-containing protein/NAD(P)H-dependent flavin oxidoreductase YrpB (nitropropane dioxygenase family)/NADP-dependent 3-hydroxy acid dehydrogenase YdfG
VFERVAAGTDKPYGIRLSPGIAIELPPQVTTIVVAASGPVSSSDVAAWHGRRVLVEVVTLAEAEAARAAGADGIVAKGCETGGRVGEVESFVLAQQVLRLGLPFWMAGGIGPHTAAAAAGAGAAGVVLSDLLALVDGVRPGLSTATAVAVMDGSETRVVGGHQIWSRPGSPAALLDADAPEAEVVARLGVDVRRDLVPLGPDAALAEQARKQWATVGGAVAGIRSSIERGLEAARVHRPLAPGSRLARRHRLVYPVAQGPMTRVSDRAAFAAAVADGGGLPFLALALQSGDDVRRLLVETAAALGDRSWGVGILGFVPPEVRQAQLDVVHELRPPLALIAGGRPSQSRSLEEAGIATYLHVPSPGLLAQFLEQGARRFVFEGRECGGHVGPRTSLSLWAAQLEVLERHGDLTDIEILLAGGIHDETSAAMASVVLGPLAGRGAGVGVLMGSAYLFTAEAVATGAITAGYQQTAQDCVSTVLLETSPGHATRCVESPYVRAFAERKAALVTAGVDQTAMWAELEELNLGRLRIASKGVVRTGDGLVEVDDAVQADEGMFMIGQVATLRSKVTTVAELHEEVSAGSTRLIDRLAEGTPAAVGPRRRPPLDIAIIGMAGVFPAAEDVETFWGNVVNGRDAITEVPAQRWDAARYYDADPAMAGRRTPSRWGGFIPAVAFDPLAYGIPPASLAAIEPVQLLSLAVADRALADAGYATRPFDRERTSVIFGAEGGTDLQGAYSFRALAAQYLGALPPELEEHLPVYTEDSFPGVLTNVIAGRIANRLDLGGVNYTIDAACASSLAALDAACKELIGGGSSTVLCGGADLHNGINDYLLFSAVRALSPSGRSRPFDAGSDGIALGEAVACVVLKRRVDAERDGDRIYAVIDGLGGSSDGRHLGITAPRKEGQQLAIRRAYAQAGFGPAQIGLVEAHGTGTVVGDQTELATLTESFVGADDHPIEPGATVLGSVKSQVGHTKCAAGIVGLIKIAKSVYHGVLPPTLHLEQPHPSYDRQTSPFRFLRSAQPWVDERRRAAVSAFGFGGTNFHVVVSSAPGDERPPHGVGSWPAELFLLRAATLEDALARAARLADTAERVAAVDPTGARHRLRDLAYTTSVADTSAPADPVRIAVVARDWADLALRLRAAADGRDDDSVFADAGGPRGKLAFVYPGQGSQRPGMLADVLLSFGWLAPILEAGRPWLAAMLPPAAHDATARARQAAEITDTRNAQPALGIAEAALTELWRRLGVGPDVAAGHSYGELSALAAAGVYDLDTLLSLSKARAAAMTEAAAALGDDPGTMAAVTLPADELEARLGSGSGVVVANRNSPRQSVISGPTAAVGAAVEELEAAGVSVRRLDVACAFHSPVIAGGADLLRRHLDDVAFAPPRIPVIAGASAAPYPPDVDSAKSLLAGGIAAPVLWVEQVEALYESGVRTFLEVGPGRVLTQLVGDVLGDRPYTAVATDVPGEHGLQGLLHACARLAVSGVEIDPEVLFAGRAESLDPAALPLPEPSWSIDGQLVRGADGAAVAGGLQPADLVPELAPLGSAPAASPTGDEREAAMLGYLTSVQAATAAQRDVMLRYLGTPTVSEDVGPEPALLRAVAPLDDQALAVDAPPAGLAAADEVHAPLDLLELLIAIVSDRTGYPESMLDPDADLEADLSIDSIKRLEILTDFMARSGLGGPGGAGDDESAIEALSRVRTLAAVVALVEERVGAAPDTAASPQATAAPIGIYELQTVEILAPSPTSPVGRGRVVVVVHDGSPTAASLVERLRERGAEVSLAALPVWPAQASSSDLASLARLGADDAVVYLGALETGPEVDARSSFAGWQAGTGAGRWLAVTLDGGLAAPPASGSAGHGSSRRATGLAGLLRVAAVEYPHLGVRSVDLPSSLVAEGPDLAAELVIAELEDEGGPAEVAWQGQRRVTRRVIPAGEPDAAPDAGLGPDSVVLLTGGARGITAAVARDLHARSGCRLEIVGRSQPGVDEDPRLAGAADLAAMRRALAETGVLDGPAAVDAGARARLRERETRSTLEALAAAGADVRYHAADVRDEQALGAIVDGIYDRHGRLDAVVHGAGVIEDRLIADKSVEGFAAVYATKVDSAQTLLRHLRPGPAVVVLFASVSGVFGNRGQVDYAAANDALDALARYHDGRDGLRVVSIDWGPWAGAGMVDAELERDYRRRGVELIDVTSGVPIVAAEIGRQGPAPSQLIVAAGSVAGLMSTTSSTQGGLREVVASVA